MQLSPLLAPKRSRAELIRTLGLVVTLLAGAGVFLRTVHVHYPIGQWLFWRYAGYWAWSLLFAAACFSAGHLVLQRVLRDRARLDRHLVFAFALGVLVFYLGMFLAGILQLYGRVFAIAWPVLLVALGGRSFARHVRPRFVRLWRLVERPSPPQILGLAVLAAFGTAGVGMLYFNILTPDNIAYDARWYHLPLAEQYFVHGGVRRFAEGWYQSTFPHLSSFIYCWAFQVPGADLFDRLLLSAHLEFVIFLATLAGIPPLVRWVIPPVKARMAWAATFLFPGILLYDSSLSVAADHIAALWAVPILLALIRAWPALDPRRCVLLGAMMAGAFSTKYQTLSILVFPSIALGVRTLYLAVLRRRGLRALAGPALATLVAVAITAPHWLKNWLWYGDPFYPFFNRVLGGRPWTPDSSYLTDLHFRSQMWTPSGTTIERIGETLRALFTFSFFPNDWAMFHGKVPVFGSLFTLGLFAIPFLGRRPRLWVMTLAALAGVFVYYWTSHQDRYLQIMLPWLVVVTAAVLALVWRAGKLPRAALAVLVAAQLIWGGDVYFLPTHPMVRGSPLNSTIQLLSSGYRNDRVDRFKRLGPMAEVGRLLPPGAVVVAHETHTVLGLNAATISDWGGWQGGISYGRMGSPAGIYRKLRELGVTHVTWVPGQAREHDSLAGDILFHDFVTRRMVDTQHAAGWSLARMAPQPPKQDGWNDRVIVLGCGGWYTAGVYRMDQLTVPQVLPRGGSFPAPLVPFSPVRPEEQWEQAAYAVVDPNCHYIPPLMETRFRQMATRGPLRLLYRVM